MNLRLTAALAAGRVVSMLSRALNRGGGTVLPGHLMARVYPDALAEMAARLPHGALLISGTNGKTTTARMAAAVFEAAGLCPIHNRAGANLPAGILSALGAHSTLMGQPKGDIGLFEVDEAHVPMAVESLQPRVLLLTNLFRDQLDRYGEVDFLARIWQPAVAALSRDATLVANADDPWVAHLARYAPGSVVTFGVEDQSVGSNTLPHEADRRLCPQCTGRLHYSRCYYGHLGHYHCEACGWRRPVPQVRVTACAVDDAGGSDLRLNLADRQVALRIPLPGLHNVYNAAAAAAAALAVGISSDPVLFGLQGLKGAFGRHEGIAVGKGMLTLILVKNPVGFNQALRTLPQGCALAVIAINDRFADGTDVSWLWDVDGEQLADEPLPVVCTGLRAHDMALRLKYAGVRDSTVEPDIDRAMKRALRCAREGDPVVVLSTYTATLEARRVLVREGLVPPFWED